MKQRKITINLVWANVFAAILFFVVLLLSSAAWYFVWGFPTFEDFPIQFIPNHNILLTFLIVFVALMAGIVLHELIHGLTWAYFAKKGFKSIRFGVLWEMLTPYCHCSEPLTVRQYCIGALMPLVVLGVIPLALAYPLKSILLLGWGILFVSAAAGDILIAWKLRKEPATNVVLDHPKEAGRMILEED